MTIGLGGITHDPKEDGKIILASTTFIEHPDYNYINLNNDIALIVLPEAIEFSGI